MNSGGAHCLKYGVTANNLLGLKVVTVEGEIVEIGGAHLDAAGYDWLGLLTGSEGQLAIVTEVTVRILRGPEGARAMLAAFRSNEVAGACVDAIIGSGIIPVALEFMDRPAIHACEHFAHAGYPLDAEAMLIIEVEGSEAEQDALLDRIRAICERHDPISLKVSGSVAESLAIWKGRKGAFGAVGRISPDYMCMDGTIPTSRLPDVLRRIGEMSDAYGLKVANIFHAGDGNLHPLIMFDANDADSFHRAEQFGADILTLCVEVGGCLTGEHGVGVEKRDLMGTQFTGIELDQQRRIKSAFDPGWLLNPNKVFPLDEARRRGMSETAPAEEAAIACRRGRGRCLPRAVADHRAGNEGAMLRPVQAARSLSTRNHAGVTLYSPKELVFAARAGTHARGRGGGARGTGTTPDRRAARFIGAARNGRGGNGGRSDAGWGGRGQSLRAASDRVGGDARPCARRSRRERDGRGDPLRRARAEERHRARSLQAVYRQPRHARGAHRNHVESVAGARADRNARTSRP